MTMDLSWAEEVLFEHTDGDGDEVALVSLVGHLLLVAEDPEGQARVRLFGDASSLTATVQGLYNALGQWLNATEPKPEPTDETPAVTEDRVKELIRVAIEAEREKTYAFARDVATTISRGQMAASWRIASNAIQGREL